MSAAAERRRVDEIASRHDYREGFNGRLARWRWEAIRPYVALRARVADLGSGDGMIVERLLDLPGVGVTAVEAAAPYVRSLRTRFSRAIAEGRLTIECTLAEDWTPADPHDAVILSGLLEHVDDPQRVLAKAAEALLPGGVVVALVPNARSLHRLLGLEMGVIDHVHALAAPDRAVGHRRYYDVDSLRAELRRAGFASTETLWDGILLKPLPNASMDELPDEVLHGLFRLGRRFPEQCAEILVAGMRP